MEYVNMALIVIGFIIIGYYQKQKIGALEKQLNSQKELIGSTEAFFDLFDLEKLKGYVDIVEKKVRTEMECQIGDLQSELNKERQKAGKTVEFLADEYIKVFRPLAKSLLLLSRDQRVTVINSMQEGISKVGLEEMSKEMDQIEFQARTEAIKALASIPTRSPKK